MTADWKSWICVAWLLVAVSSTHAATPMIAAGGSESIFLNGDGSVWGTGYVTNYYPGATSPVRILQLPNVVSVATGGNANFALLADGTVWGSGSNNAGQLADGTTLSRSQPQRIPGLSGIKAFEASVFGHFFAVKEDGTVWAWGKNDKGQLGDGTRTDRYFPVQIAGLSNVTRISLAGFSSLALKGDGTVWVSGWTCCGGAGNGREPLNDVDPETYHVVPSRVLNLDQVIAISAGAHHHLALRADGTVWTWGLGVDGQNGTGMLTNQLLPTQIPGLDRITAIDARGLNYSLALRSDGTVWTWGTNRQGTLGVSGITYSAVPMQVPGVADVVAISAGYAHVLAMRRDGSILAWGVNAYGQLGDGTLQDNSQPNAVLAQGGSGQFNIVQPAPASFNKLPQAQVRLNVSTGVAPLTVQASAINAGDPDGTIVGYTWKTSNGQQATGSSATFVFSQGGTYQINVLIRDNAGGVGNASQQVVVAPGAAQVSATPKVGMGGQSGIALTNDGRILTWGGKGFIGLYDASAQNALPDVNSRPIATGISGAVDLAIQQFNVHVLKSDGTAFGWGNNDFGAVGSGSRIANVNQPEQVAGLPPARALAAGGFHTLALTQDGRVFAWGGNTSGQLGLGDNQTRFEPAEVTGLSGVTAIAAGFSFSVALKADGTVWAWGNNSGSQLGDRTTTARNRPFQVPGLSGITKIFAPEAIFAQRADGSVWVTGGLPVAFPGDPGALSGARRISTFDGFVQFAGSFQHFIALKPDGTVWTGGQRLSPALGYATSSDVAGLRQVTGITDAIAIAAGPTNSTALRRDGTVLTWGLNSFGQIGDGTLAYQQSPVLAVNEAATNFLDLVPEVANVIARERIPPFLLATFANGDLSALTLFADVRGLISSGAFASDGYGQFVAGYNVYVAAAVPSGGAALYFQLDSGNSWSAFRWPMAEFIRGVALDNVDAQVRLQILQNANLSAPALSGAAIIIGYGADPDEMLRTARFRTIFTVAPQ